MFFILYKYIKYVNILFYYQYFIHKFVLFEKNNNISNQQSTHSNKPLSKVKKT